MQTPVQITFRDMEPSAALESRIRDLTEKLEECSDRITRCHVVVEAPHKHHRHGRVFHVRIDLGLPGRQVAIGSRQDGRASHEDPYVAVRDAFRAARRSLVHHAHPERRAAESVRPR